MKPSVRGNIKTNEFKTNRKRRDFKESPNKDGFFDAICEVSNGSSKDYNKKHDCLDGGTF